MQAGSVAPLKSCLKVKGAPKRAVPPISFQEEAQVLLPDDSRASEPVLWEPKRRRKYKEDKHPGHDSDSESDEDSWGLGSNDLAVDVSKFLTKSIYDSSSEEEGEAPPEKPIRPTNPSKSADASTKSKDTPPKSPKGKKRTKSKKAPALRRTKSTQWSKRSLQVHCTPKDLLGHVPRLALPPAERFPSTSESKQWKRLLMEGFVHLGVDEEEEPLPCRFTMCGNGVMDCFQATEVEGRTEFSYFLSLLPLFFSDADTTKERTEKLSSTFSSYATVCLDYFRCPRSDEMEEESWEAPALVRRQNVLVLFASSSDKNKCLSVLESFFITSPLGSETSRPHLLRTRQNSLRNIGKIFRSGKKVKGEGRTNSVPFPGIALHEEASPSRHVRGGSLPQALPTLSGEE